MSFLSILKTIGTDALKIEPIAAAAVSLVNPALANLMNGISGKIQGAVTNAELTITQAKSGGIKADAVVADFESGLSIAQEVLAAEGKAITYDPVALQTAINNQVAAFNAAATLKASFKIVPLSVTATPPAS